MFIQYRFECYFKQQILCSTVVLWDTFYKKLNMVLLKMRLYAQKNH